MKNILGSAGLILAMVLPGLGQTTAVSHPQVRLQAVAWQDQDDRPQQNDDEARRRDRDQDRDRRDNREGQQYQGVLAPEWQAKFDSYYSRWQNYRARNDRDEMASMEGRMRDIMDHYNIPQDVPYDAVASPNVSGYGNGDSRGARDRDEDRNGYEGSRRGDEDRDRGEGYGRDYHNVLAPEWQEKFDRYYSRWLNYRDRNDRDEMASMENRMRDIMNQYNIPPDVPYDAVASQGGDYDRDRR